MCLALELAGSGVELDFSVGKETFGEGNDNPLQYSCLENPMEGGAWWATVCGVAKNRTRLSDFTSLDYKVLFIFHCNLNNTLSFAFSIYSVFPPVSSLQSILLL